MKRRKTEAELQHQGQHEHIGGGAQVKKAAASDGSREGRNSQQAEIDDGIAAALGVEEVQHAADCADDKRAIDDRAWQNRTPQKRKTKDEAGECDADQNKPAQVERPDILLADVRDIGV